VSETPLDADPADVAEQRAEVALDGDEVGPPPAPLGDAPWDADPADVAEQRAEVPLDDDWS
jgi:hypothetical protein